MASRNLHIFLSAVSSEFERARSQVAIDLRSRGVDVKLQDEFRKEAGADTTLHKLHDYIRDCSAVICIVGGRSGASPPDPAARPFVEKKILPQAISRASYTQWEFFFARHYRKRISLHVANPDYVPDKPPIAEDDAALQQQFVAHLLGMGLDYTPFSTVDELCRRVLREDWSRRPGHNSLVRKVGAAAAILLLVCVAAIWHRGWHSASPSVPLSGNVDVVVWDRGNARRRGLSLADPVALPLRNSDQIRVEAAVNRPAYVYLIWIDSQGAVTPLYPWMPGDWDKLAHPPKPVATVKLPAAVDEGWPMAGASGMETLMLLARETPLPSDFKLAELLRDLPAQSMQSNRSLVWFANGRSVSKSADVSRAPNFFDPQQIDDPVLRTQRLLHERLGTHFDSISAVSFAHAGE